MKTLLDEIITAAGKGKTLCLSTIVRKLGSAPRGLGSKCLFDTDSILWGSVGGGALEEQVFRVAKEVIARGIPKILSFRLDNTDASKEGMICGGNVDVFLEPISPSHLPFWKLYKDLMEKGIKKFCVITFMDPTHWEKPDPPKVIFEGSILSKALEGISLEWIQMRIPTHQKGSVSIIEDPQKGPLLVEEPLFPFRLVLFGAGHISRYVAHIARMLDFEVWVLDDRPEFLDSRYFPEGTQMLISSFEDSVSKVYIDERTFLVIVTRGHLGDRDVLRQALKTEACYVGMIGSKRKRDMIYETLKKEGVREELLKRVSCPIGLRIGAETPQEIAVSIMAEVIQKKAQLFG